MPKDDGEDALVQARCAKANLENMVVMMPALKRHPLLSLVQAQLDLVIILLEGGPE